MRILALDTALTACSAALAEIDEDGSARVLASESEGMERGHAEALMPMIARVLEAAPGAVDRIATTTGPGSFTGLRVAVSAARGLALAWNVPALGVTTLAALAASLDAPSVVAIDARRGEAYWQIFIGGAALSEPAIASYEAIASALPDDSLHALGSGAATLAALLPDRLNPLPRSVPDMVDVARLAARADAGPPVRPLYIRPPDAKPQAAQLAFA